MSHNRPVGTAEMACEAVLRRYYGTGPLGIDYLASGEDRTVYIADGIVYKVGSRDTANPYDHEVQQEARARGYRWAPPASTLWTVTTEYGDEEVLAMPYLEDDGTNADPQALAEMHEQTGGGVDRSNYVVIDGQPVVFDGCTVQLKST